MDQYENSPTHYGPTVLLDTFLVKVRATKLVQLEIYGNQLLRRFRSPGCLQHSGLAEALVTLCVRT